MMLEYEENVWTDWGVEELRFHKVYFNKKRLLKAIHELGFDAESGGMDAIKIFMAGYVYPDVEEVMSAFDWHGWQYKDVVSEDAE